MKSYFIEQVKKWRRANGASYSIFETVALFGIEWCNDENFIRLVENASIMAGFEQTEGNETGKESYILYNEIIDR